MSFAVRWSWNAAPYLAISVLCLLLCNPSTYAADLEAIDLTVAKGWKDPFFHCVAFNTLPEIRHYPFWCGPAEVKSDIIAEWLALASSGAPLIMESDFNSHMQGREPDPNFSPTYGLPRRCSTAGTGGVYFCTQILTLEMWSPDGLYLLQSAKEDERYYYPLAQASFETFILGRFRKDSWSPITLPGIQLVDASGSQLTGFFPSESQDPAPFDRCYHMTKRQDDFLVGCDSSILRVAMSRTPWTMTLSTERFPLGVGVFRHVHYSPHLDRLFIASSTGLGFVVDGLTLALKSIAFSPSMTSRDPFTYVYVDEDYWHSKYPRTPVAWWGTENGILFKTDTGDGALNALAFAPSTSALHGIAQIDPLTALPVDYSPYTDTLYMMPALRYSLIDDPSNYTKDAFLTKFQKANCRRYGCNSCVRNPYCGWCYSTASCIPTYASCPAGKSEEPLATSPNQCPIFNSLDVSSGANTGGTPVTVYISYVKSTTNSSAYYCEWQTSANKTVALAPASAISPGSVTCITPPIDTTWMPATGNSLSTKLSVLYGTVKWAPDRAPFSFYSCRNRICPQCSHSSRPECGWCLSTSSCSSFRNGACPFDAASTGLIEPSQNWNSLVCPLVRLVDPPYASATSLPLLTVHVTNVPALSSSQFSCRFTNTETRSIYYATNATSSSTPDSDTQFQCYPPANLIPSPIPQLHQVEIYRSGLPLTTLRTDTSFQDDLVELYKCESILQCDICNDAKRNGCKWCAATRTCVSLKETTEGCSADAQLCPRITKISPTSTQLAHAPNLPVAITGTGFSAYISRSLTCSFFAPPSTPVFTPAQIYNDSLATCDAPNDMTTFGLGNWSLTLAVNSVNIMTGAPFLVYDCALLKDCFSCASQTYPDCSWCKQPQLTGCYNDTTVPPTCSPSPVNQHSGTCPTLTNIVPHQTSIGSNVSITLYGSGFEDLDPADLSQLNCVLYPPSTSLISQIDASASYPTANTFVCDQVALDTPGNTSVAIFDSKQGSNATNLLNIAVMDCSTFTTCGECLQASCVLCGGACVAECSVQSLEQLICPSISSVTPMFVDLSGKAEVTISGTDFLTTRGSGKKDEDSMWKEEALLRERLFDLINSGSNDLEEQVEWMMDGAKRDVWVTDAVQQVTYECAWGSQILPVSAPPTPTTIRCPTPPDGVPRNLTLSVRLNGNTYLTVPDPISFFTCPTFDETVDGCTDACTSSPHCGWCTGSSTCTSTFVCSDENIWQPKCITASMNRPGSPIPGGSTLQLTLSTALTPRVTRSRLECRFGAKPSPAATTAPSNASVDATSCLVPPFPSPNGATVPVSVYYEGKRLTVPQPFVYVDCTQYASSCPRCTAQPVCGWCPGNKGSKKCSLQAECPSPDEWTKKKCPPSALALGLGIGLGLLFLLAVVILILFLIRRARRKQGIYIKMQEPNYAAIAWGADRNLLYRIPSTGKWNVLLRSLLRQDHLLQLVLSLSCPPTEQDSLAKGLVYVAASRGDAVAMIQAIIRAEVRQCKEENTLFRSNSVASKMYKFFSRIVGIKYLYNCIARLILELEVLGEKSAKAEGDLESNPQKQSSSKVSLFDVSMELDNEKGDGTLEADVDTDTNNLQLQLICQKILHVLIKKTLHNIPVALREIFIEIDRSVSQKFPGSEDAIYKGLGGLFFLRFVCPAITAPHVYGLLSQPPNPATQRQLVLITKVIQSIANMQAPGKKEKYMEVMNDFIVMSIPRIVVFYNHLRQAANINSQGKMYEVNLEVPENVVLNGLAATQAVLVPNAPKLKEWLEASFLTAEEQRDANQIIVECLQDDPIRPKTTRAEKAASSGAKKKKK